MLSDAGCQCYRQINTCIHAYECVCMRMYDRSIACGLGKNNIAYQTRKGGLDVINKYYESLTAVTRQRLLYFLLKHFSLIFCFILSDLLQLFINNEWHKSKSGKTFATINPTTEQPIAEVQAAGKEDIDIAVHAARQAFK